MPTNEIFDFIETYLQDEKDYMTYACCEESYLVMGPRDISKASVALVAHVDTVGDVHGKLPSIYANILDNEYLISAGTCCLDDRTGVAIALRSMGVAQPAYIFLKGEEIGCVGAITLVEDYPELESVFGEDHALQCLIEIDRKGINEVVFYELNYPEFENLFLTKYEKNISHAWTDVAVLGPMWNIAAANVSAGYYKEHTDNEHTNLKDIESCFLKLRDMVYLFDRRSAQGRCGFEYQGGSSTCCMLLMSYNYQEPEAAGSTSYDETLPFQGLL